MRYAFAICLLFVGCGDDVEEVEPHDDDDVPADSALTDRDLQDREDENEYVGVIQIGHAVAVAPEVEGRVLDISVGLGEAIQTGQLVARIDGARYESELARARNELTSRRTAHRRARSVEALRRKMRDTERYLVANGAASRQALETAANEVDGARAERMQRAASVKEQEHRVEWLTLQVSKTQVRTEQEGRVTSILLERGDLAGPGRPIIRLRRGDKLRVLFGIPVAIRDRARIGGGVTIHINGEEEATCSGRISAVAPKVEPRAQLLRVEAELVVDDMLVCAEDGLSVRVKMTDLDLGEESMARVAEDKLVEHQKQVPASQAFEPVVTPLRTEPSARDIIGRDVEQVRTGKSRAEKCLTL